PAQDRDGRRAGIDRSAAGCPSRFDLLQSRRHCQAPAEDESVWAGRAGSSNAVRERCPAKGDGASIRFSDRSGQEPMKIRFSQPTIVGREFDYLREALEQRHLANSGPFTQRCQAWLAARLNVAHAYLTHSATAALEMSTLLAELGDGDEVIMPAFTFV